MAAEQRKSKRLALSAEISIKPLGSDVPRTQMIVEIENVSKNGIGFICDEVLEAGSTYEANLKIWTNETLDVFLKIVRRIQVGNQYQYGAVFIGMSDVDAGRIQTYQTILDMKSDEG